MRALLPLTGHMGTDRWRKLVVCKNTLREFRRPPHTTTSQPRWTVYETTKKFMTRSRPRGGEGRGDKTTTTPPPSQPTRHYRSLPPLGPAQRPHQGQRAARAGRESPPAARGAGGASFTPHRPGGGAARSPSTFPPPSPRPSQDGGRRRRGGRRRWGRAPRGLRAAGASR